MSFALRKFLKSSPLSLMATTSAIYTDMSTYTDNHQVAFLSSIVASMLFEVQRQKMIKNYEIYSKIDTPTRVLNVINTYGFYSIRYIGA